LKSSGQKKKEIGKKMREIEVKVPHKEISAKPKLARRVEPHVDPTTAAVIALATKAISALTREPRTAKAQLVRLLYLSASRDLQRLRKLDPKFDPRIFLREESSETSNRSYVFGRAKALFEILDILDEGENELEDPREKS